MRTFAVYNGATGQIAFTVRSPDAPAPIDGLLVCDVDASVTDATHWILEGFAVPLSAPNTPPSLKITKPALSIDACRRALMAELAALRYGVEVGGTKLADGTDVRTGREAVALLTEAMLKLEREPAGSTIQFKGGAGFVETGLAAVTELWSAASSHRQLCFSAEQSVTEKILRAVPQTFNLADEWAAACEAFGLAIPSSRSNHTE
jgi:hypothetical protein